MIRSTEGFEEFQVTDQFYEDNSDYQSEKFVRDRDRDSQQNHSQDHSRDSREDSERDQTAAQEITKMIFEHVMRAKESDQQDDILDQISILKTYLKAIQHS